MQHKQKSITLQIALGVAMCFILLLFTSFFTSCNTANIVEDINHTVDDPLINSHTKPVIAEIIDYSGTTAGREWPMPQRNFYEAQVKFIEGQNGGDIYVYNTSLPIPNPVILHIQPTLVENDVYSSDYEANKAAQDSIKRINETAKEMFFKELDERVLNYTPPQGDDYSYIDRHVQSLIKLIGENQFASSKMKFVFAYSDMVDDIPGGKVHKLSPHLIEAWNKMLCESYWVSFSDTIGLGKLKHNPLASFPDFNQHLLIHKYSLTKF